MGPRFREDDAGEVEAKLEAEGPVSGINNPPFAETYPVSSP
jgi:hypothetical protein